MDAKPHKIQLRCVMSSSKSDKTFAQLLEEGLSFKEINDYIKSCLNTYKIESARI